MLRITMVKDGKLEGELSKKSELGLLPQIFQKETNKRMCHSFNNRSEMYISFRERGKIILRQCELLRTETRKLTEEEVVKFLCNISGFQITGRKGSMNLVKFDIDNFANYI